MKLVLVKGIDQRNFREVLDEIRTYLTGNPPQVYFGTSEPIFDVELYDTETKVTLRGAEAIAELLKDPYETN